MKEHVKHAAIALILVICFGIAGTIDCATQQAEEAAAKQHTK